MVIAINWGQEYESRYGGEYHSPVFKLSRISQLLQWCRNDPVGTRICDADNFLYEFTCSNCGNHIHVSGDYNWVPTVYLAVPLMVWLFGYHRDGDRIRLRGEWRRWAWWSPNNIDVGLYGRVCERCFCLVTPSRQCHAELRLAESHPLKSFAGLYVLMHLSYRRVLRVVDWDAAMSSSRVLYEYAATFGASLEDRAFVDGVEPRLTIGEVVLGTALELSTHPSPAARAAAAVLTYLAEQGGVVVDEVDVYRRIKRAVLDPASARRQVAAYAEP